MQGIFDYLSSPIYYTQGVSSLLSEVESLKVLAKPLSAEQWQRLGQRRYMASNTLRTGFKYEGWVKANIWLGENIDSFLMGPTWEKVEKLYEILMGEKSSIRHTKVYSGDHEYLPPNHIPEALDLFYTQLMDNKKSSLEKAFLSYVSLITLHPFEDGNGRLARLASDGVLIANGYLPALFDSSVAGHVAQLVGQFQRDRSQSFIKYLMAIKNSYKLG